MEITLKPYQHDFIYSKSRFPAAVCGWGVGKTFMALMRAQIYSKGIPDNLGVIFRKTAKSLSDSTLKDFEKYTGNQVDSQRNFTYPNKSRILFRHIDEIGDINQQNLNLGWFFIEQGEELDSDYEFFMLFGRLRRDVKPTKEFEALGLPLRSGWVIANAGDHWMKPLWKGVDGAAPKLEESTLIEATTWDNSENLPQDFLDSLKVLEKTKPEIYRQYVMNDWSVTPDQHVLIRGEALDKLKGVFHDEQFTKKVISCDPSQGGDDCVIKAFENTKVVETMHLKLDDTMKIVGELLIIGKRHGTDNFAVDAIGIGAGICDRLEEMGKHVIRINSAEEATDKERYANRRAEMWGHALDLIQRREVEYFEDAELRRQLTAVRYDPKAINSQGYLKLEPKQETKKRLQRSPDDADAYIYGLWALRELSADTDLSMSSLFPFQKRKAVFSGAGGY